MRVPMLLPVMITAFCLSLPLGASAGEEEIQIYELSWLDKNHLQKQVERIDDLARTQLGTQIHNNRDDLELLQRIVNKGLIRRDERLLLQAMGAVLGNLLVEELGLQWMVYEDDLGRSRAACVKDTEHCLFPITMLSRRMEVGIMVKVQDIYDNAVTIITPYLPKSPYQQKISRHP
ncbi:MAG: DUF3806 domain-containing protein [Exilibacterium sp.]